MKRVLFDHCVPKPLRRHLTGFQIQQNLRARQIAVMELPQNRLATLLLLVPAIQHALTNIAPGGYVQIPMP